MTLPSKSAQSDDTIKALEKVAVDSLEQANAGLPEEVLSDIAQARMNALRTVRQQEVNGSQKPRFSKRLTEVRDRLRYQLSLEQLSLHNIKVTAPVAVAVVVAVLVSYNQNNAVPVLPTELVSGDVPTEELAMLEDLEFASWLAEQQQEGVL